jgi:hypothetical protein
MQEHIVRDKVESIIIIIIIIIVRRVPWYHHMARPRASDGGTASSYGG